MEEELTAASELDSDRGSFSLDASGRGILKQNAPSRTSDQPHQERSQELQPSPCAETVFEVEI